MSERLIISRLFLAAITLFAVATFIFWATEILPGDIAARVLGRFSTEEARQAFNERLHLDRPAIERYFIWLERAVRGDFGKSLVSQRYVSEIIATRLSASLVLGLYAFILYIPLSIFLAAFSAVYKDRLIDNVISFFTLIGLALPEFVLGTIFLIVFAITLNTFPAISRFQPGMNLSEIVHSLTLPALTVAIVMSVYAIRVLRINLIEVLESKYVRMAYLKGLPRYRILFWHALPNALSPMLNVTALNLAYLIGGIVIVEQAFGYNGLGSLLINAVHMRDVPVVQATTLLVSSVYIIANLLADIFSILLNPKLRTG